MPKDPFAELHRVQMEKEASGRPDGLTARRVDAAPVDAMLPPVDGLTTRNDAMLSGRPDGENKERSPQTEYERLLPSREGKQKLTYRLAKQNALLLGSHLKMHGDNFQAMIDRFLDEYAVGRIEGWQRIRQDGKPSGRPDDKPTRHIDIDHDLDSLDKTILNLYGDICRRPIKGHDVAAYREKREWLRKIPLAVIEYGIRLCVKEARADPKVTINSFRWVVKDIVKAIQANMNADDVDEHLQALRDWQGN